MPEEVEDPLTNSGLRKHLYALHGNVNWVTGFFYRLKPAVVTIVAEAVFRIGKKTLKNWILMGLAVAAFIAIDVFQVPFPLIVLSAGVRGFVGSISASTLKL